MIEVPQGSGVFPTIGQINCLEELGSGRFCAATYECADESGELWGDMANHDGRRPIGADSPVANKRACTIEVDGKASVSWFAGYRPAGRTGELIGAMGVTEAVRPVDRALDSAARLLRAIDARSQAAQVAQLRDRVAEPRRTPNPSSNSRPNTPHGSQADAIRHYAMANHVAPWRESGGDLLTIRAGDIQREMGLRNATPNVCSALEGAKFLALANVALVRRDGPRRSTTTTYHYRRKMSAKAVSGGLWCLTV